MVHTTSTGQFVVTIKAIKLDPQMGKCQVGLQTPTKILWNHMTVNSFSSPLGNHDLDLGVWAPLGNARKKLEHPEQVSQVLCSV